MSEDKIELQSMRNFVLFLINEIKYNPVIFSGQLKATSIITLFDGKFEF